MTNPQTTKEWMPWANPYQAMREKHPSNYKTIQFKESWQSDDEAITADYDKIPSAMNIWDKVWRPA